MAQVMARSGDVEKVLSFVPSDVANPAWDALYQMGLLSESGHCDESIGDIVGKLDADNTKYSAMVVLSAMGGHVPTECAEKVAALISDRDFATRGLAAGLIGSMAAGVAKSPAMGKIEALLKSDAIGVRAAAATALGNMGPRALPAAGAVAALLADDSLDESNFALRLGNAIRRPAATAVRPKCAALFALGKMGSEKHMDQIAEALKDNSFEVRACAAEALGDLGADVVSESETFLLSEAATNDDTHPVRAAAVGALGKLKADNYVSTVAEALIDKKQSVRVAALGAMGALGDAGEAHTHEVFRCLTEDSVTVRAAAVRCLSLMGEMGQNYASVVATQLFDQQPDIKVAAIEALGRMGVYGAAFEDEVGSFLSDEDPRVQGAATKSIESMRAGKRH
jgi:HEAT repeat protein